MSLCHKCGGFDTHLPNCPTVIARELCSAKHLLREISRQIARDNNKRYTDLLNSHQSIGLAIKLYLAKGGE